MNNISNIDSSNSITVTGVDMDKPIISDFSISSLNNQYKSLSTNLNITITNKNPSSLQMCISNSGYLKDCSWVAYSSSYSWNLPGSYDGIKRVVYLSVKDDANHISNRSAEYYPYTECSEKTSKDYTSWGSCSVSCGGGIQSRTYQNYDSYTGIKCGNLITQKQSCQTQSCCSSLSTSYGSWGSCSVSCGGGTKKRTITYRSNYNNTVCSTKVESQSCNTQSCDSTPPIVSCSTNATSYTSGSVIITVNASDPESGIQRISYAEPGGTWTSYTGPFWTNHGYIYVFALNNAGKIASTLCKTKVDRWAPFTPGINIEKTQKESVIESVSCSKNEEKSHTDNHCEIHARGQRTSYWFWGSDDYTGEGYSDTAQFKRETWVNNVLRDTSYMSPGGSFPYKYFSGAHHVVKISSTDNAGNQSPGVLIIDEYYK